MYYARSYTLAGEYASPAILDQKVQWRLVTTEQSTGNVHFEFSFLPAVSPVFVSLVTLITSFVIYIKDFSIEVIKA